MVVDGPQCEVLAALPTLGALVIVDDELRCERAAGARVRFIGRPFTAGAQCDEIDRMML